MDNAGAFYRKSVYPLCLQEIDRAQQDIAGEARERTGTHRRHQEEGEGEDGEGGTCETAGERGQEGRACSREEARA